MERKTHYGAFCRRRHGKTNRCCQELRRIGNTSKPFSSSLLEAWLGLSPSRGRTEHFKSAQTGCGSSRPPKRGRGQQDVIPPNVADRLDGLGGIIFEHLKTPSIDDLIENQIENIGAWDIDDANGAVDPMALWDIRCNLAIIGILAAHRASQPET
jgi:hypothetical protein